MPIGYSPRRIVLVRKIALNLDGGLRVLTPLEASHLDVLGSRHWVPSRTLQPFPDALARFANSTPLALRTASPLRFGTWRRLLRVLSEGVYLTPSINVSSTSIINLMQPSPETKSWQIADIGHREYALDLGNSNDKFFTRWKLSAFVLWLCLAAPLLGEYQKVRGRAVPGPVFYVSIAVTSCAGIFRRYLTWVASGHIHSNFKLFISVLSSS